MRTRRLPGFAFEVQTPPPTDVLPRMDVAVFAGFAASGPLQRPVPVESAAQFEMIFGADVPLAWDSAQGQMVCGYLAPAVRAFFRNGGRRAWIIRVAGQPQINFFPVCGLLQATFDAASGLAEVRPAYAQARSAGSWADDQQVATALLSDGLALTVETLDPLQFLATLTAPNDLAPGDLLRVTFAQGYVLFCSVSSVTPAPASPPAPNTYRVQADKAIWFRLGESQLPAVADGQAVLLTHTAPGAAVAASVPLTQDSPVSLEWLAPGREQAVQLDLALLYNQAPPLGSLLRVDFGPDTFWLLVEKVSSAFAGAAPADKPVHVEGHGLWQVPQPGGGLGALGALVQAERLSFELWARSDGDSPLRLSGLTFDQRHPLCWCALPTDEQFYPDPDRPTITDRADLWAQVATPRFPLAGYRFPLGQVLQPEALFVPIAIRIAPEYYLGPDESAVDPLTRAGLADFTSSLFLDADLAGVGVRDLINEADTLRFYTDETRSLKGIHAALGIEEATLIVVPDVVQRGWVRRLAVRPENPPPSAPPVRPNWWHFLDCAQPQDLPAVDEPLWGNFLDCGIRVIRPAPELTVSAEQPTSFTLSWTQPEAGLAYVLQEATRPDFSDARAIYTGPDDQYTLYGHASGVYYYRVRAWLDGNSSNWSNGLAVSSAPLQPWLLVDAGDYVDEALLTVQQAILRMCAARSDLLAVLSLPAHYRVDDALAYAHKLTTTPSSLGGFEESRTFSFGALYHPWLIGREENRPDELRQTPPDGAMTGIIARRTLARGAWIAPANEFLTGVVALAPAIEPGRWLDLQNSQLNLIRRLPKGFTAMNSDTLTPDEDLRPINVRRLLILLRRLVLRQGATYVFEPNNAAFRRSVQRGFEGLMDLMFLRGAFAGDLPATSYQVVTDDSLNPPESVSQGRFIVELRVAPSLPMTFLTIRLVQTGERTLVAQEA